MPHAHSVGFCCNVELTLQLVSVCKTIVVQVVNDSFIITVSDIDIPTCPTCSECLFLGGTNFLPLTHYDILQLLIVLNLNFLTKQQLTSQRPGNLLRQSQVGSWSWNETHLKIHMTYSGGTC